MKSLAMTAVLMLAALGAHAEMPQLLGSDHLSQEILSKTTLPNGGVTAAVRVGTGQAIELKLADVTAVAPAAAAPKLAPAATQAYLDLQPADGLKPKAVKAKAKKEKAPKRAVEQLKHIAAKTAAAKF